MKKRILSPFLVILLSFLFVIIIGTLLLKLPFSHVEGKTVSWVDAFFTATSAVCVTGLTSVGDLIYTYSPFGQTIIAIIIQIGGLGLVVITAFIFSVLGLKIGINERFLIKEALNQNSLRGMVRLVKSVITITFIIETIGGIIYFAIFIQDYPFWQALGSALFQSISSFNNAGFHILPTNHGELLYINNTLFILNSALLIIFGGIGFAVIYDVFSKKRFHKLTLHSKIVIKVTVLLLFLGAALIFFLEHGSLSFLQAFFYSTSARTAGLTLGDISSFKTPTILVIIVLMFIGASPGSTGGGIKTTTIYVLYKSFSSLVQGKEPISSYRRISHEVVTRSFGLATIALFAVIFCVFLLSIFEPDVELSRLIFEVVSAFGTVGFSLNLTPYLQWYSKILLAILMIFGRLGPITVINALNANWAKINSKNVKYIEESIAIG